ncbi:MAG: HNH endonuclease, partial [Candidatus Brocadiae bacterium]|nr:HNH endonuclease [Candidatus Brocadiia bacterium]
IDAWLQAEAENPSTRDLASYAREKLQVLRFVTNSRPFAIKTFQTVNDRGKELSLLDKTKSFLMFYVTRYLEDDAEVFRTVEQAFGRVFDNYDAAKDLAVRFTVDYLVRPQFRFNEDEFLRYAYHYAAKDLRSRFELQSGYEYGITPERVFDGFVKGACRELRNRPAALREFVLGWCEDLGAVSQALVSLLARIPEDASYSRLFRFQGPNASVYPLLVTAQARGFLDDDMLSAIAVLDLRVYQVRGTEPKADLYRQAVSKMKTGERDAIYNTIVWYCREFGTDQELDSILRGRVYRQSFAKYLLWQRAVADDREVSELDYELYADCQVEHVLPDEPSTFDVTTFGFATDEEYEATKHGFGNLTVLESDLNRRAQNKPPGDKAPIYAKSHLAATRVLGTRISEAGFTRESQVKRVDDLIQFFRQKWPIPLEVPGLPT